MTTSIDPSSSPPSLPAMAPAVGSSHYLGACLVREQGAHDLSRNRECANFQFFAYRESPAAIELVAFCDADAMTERDIVDRRDEFFGLLRRLPHELALRPRGRNPNGLLGFVYSGGCTEQMARFIAKQSSISHAAGTGAVAVAWAIDVPGQRIHTHDNPVSILPPVVVMARTVYPGLDYLQDLLHRMPEPDRQIIVEHVDPLEEPKSVLPAEKRILFLAANSMTQPLDLERELQRIETDLRMAKVRDSVELKQVWAVTIDRLMQAMLDDSPTIVHFSGHGVRDGIKFRDEGGAEQVVSGEALASLFALFKDTVRCVVLNACFSEPQAHAIRRHIPHVIGMRAGIPDRSALAFSAGFYKAVAAGKDVPFAFQLGLASVQSLGDASETLVTLL